MSDRQVRMICGAIGVLAGAVVFGQGVAHITVQGNQMLGAALMAGGAAVFGIEYLRSMQEDRRSSPGQPDTSDTEPPRR